MELIKLQDDLYIPENFEDDHRYLADAKGEKEYTGITTVLRRMAKPALIPWAAKMTAEWIRENCEQDEEGYWAVNEEALIQAVKHHSSKKERAGEHGTATHARVEQYINDCIAANEILEPKTYDGIEPFIVWAKENVDKFLYAERPVHSKTLWLAGTIDFGAQMKDGTKRVGDLKTGSNIYYEALLQTEAYQILAEEEGDTPYQGSVIVNMKKDGTFQTQTRDRSEIDRKAFLGLLDAYRGNATYTSPKY